MIFMSFMRRPALALLVSFAPACLGAQAHPLVSTTPGHQGSACTQSTPTIQQLTTLESAAERRFQCIGVSLDGDTVKALRLETHSFSALHGRPEAERIEILEFSPTVVGSSHGAVLDGVPGHDAIILHGRLSVPPGKIQLDTSYLYNGFTGEYRTCRITLDRTPETGWRLLDGHALRISHITIRTRQIPVIGSFGIASLEGACS